MFPKSNRVIVLRTTKGEIIVHMIYDFTFRGFVLDCRIDGEVYTNCDVDMVRGELRFSPPGRFATGSEALNYAKTIMYLVAQHVKDDQCKSSALRFIASSEIPQQ